MGTVIRTARFVRSFWRTRSLETHGAGVSESPIGMVHEKKAERSFANAVAATAIVSKALSGNDEEKQPTEDEAESEEEESDTLPPVHKCKDDESPPDTDAGVQHMTK